MSIESQGQRYCPKILSLSPSTIFPIMHIAFRMKLPLTSSPCHLHLSSLLYTHTHTHTHTHTNTHTGCSIFPSSVLQYPQKHRFSHSLALLSACHMGFPFQVWKLLHFQPLSTNAPSIQLAFWPYNSQFSLFTHDVGPHSLLHLPLFYSLPTPNSV